MITPLASFPVYVVAKPAAATEFYQHLGFAEVFNSGWYVHLATETGIQIGFLEPDHPSQPAFLHAAHSGAGAIFSLEVADATAALKEAESLGLKMAAELKAEAWGQLHFMLRDPNGLIVDVVERTEPTEEFAAQYSQE